MIKLRNSQEKPVFLFDALLHINIIHCEQTLRLHLQLNEIKYVVPKIMLFYDMLLKSSTALYCECIFGL